jgi:hypothetical protein
MNESKQKLNTILLSAGVCHAIWQTSTFVPDEPLSSILGWKIPPFLSVKLHRFTSQKTPLPYFFKIHFSNSVWIFQPVSFPWISPSKRHMCFSSFLFMLHACLSYHHDLITIPRGTRKNLRVVSVPGKIWTRPHLKKSQNIFISTSLLSEDLFMPSPNVLLRLPCACICVFVKSCINFLSPPCELYVCSIISHLDVTAILSLNGSIADSVIIEQTSENGLTL